MTNDQPAAQGTALITGASSGIGAIYADRLARRGHDLILVARDAARLETLAQRLRSETSRAVDVLPADLTDPLQIAAVARRIAGQSDLTLLVNNAGIALSGTLTTSSADEVTRLITLNVTAPALLAQAAGIAFAARGAGGIINIASVLALAPELGDATYSGTKAFMLNLSHGLAHELAARGVRVQAVLPGATRTEIWERSGKDINAFPPEMVMAAEDLVDAALIGFDRGETVSIPPLQDQRDWLEMEKLRLGLAPVLSRREVSPRYQIHDS